MKESDGDGDGDGDGDWDISQTRMQAEGMSKR
jgi:hypothetical protein